MSRVLFLFLDGVGLGAVGGSNPFATTPTPFLEAWLGGPLTADLVADASATRSRGPAGATVGALDATLGYEGLPQSATGQATLLTGRNGAEAMSGHYGPWPGPTLKRLLDEGTLFSEVRSAGGGARLANAYPPGYFAALGGRTLRVNVPVYAARAAGVPLVDLDAYRRGEGVAADLTGAYLARLDPALAPLTPREAGARLARAARGAAFTFFDLWLTDRLGHRGTPEEAADFVAALDAFLGGVVSALDGVTLLVTSDHGNLEDLAVRTHTRAPVPLLAHGPAADAFEGLARLDEVAPALRRALGLPAPRT